MRKPREVAPTGERAARQALRRFPRLPTETQVRVPLSVEIVALLEEAQSLAEKEGAEMTRIDHLGSALLRRQRPPSGLASLLAACGADLELARRRLRVPAAVRRVEVALQGARRERVEAAARGDEGKATAASERVEDLRRKLPQALESWQARWGEEP